jgi:pimeloyl-ACP methyl ester carboxylesterase
MSALVDHYRSGDGEPLLLLHGFTATWKTWGRLPELLARDHDVLAPTLPGHTGGPGLEGRPTIDAIVDRLESALDEVGWERPHIAGFSLGGWLGFELAKRGRARTLTALAPGGAQGDAESPEARRIARLFRRGRMAARAARPLVRSLSRSRSFRRRAMRDMMLSGHRLTPVEAFDMISCYADTPVFDELLLEMGASGGLRDLDGIEIPVHLVWGERDRVIPLKHASFFRGELPEASFVVIPDAGHVPFWDAPDAVADEIRKTIAEASREPRGPR